ncbi:MAG: pilin [Candidatus Saccharibacteria bacterium]|nr:pilin [Candidatus Saccharibacteria bacterium]
MRKFGIVLGVIGTVLGVSLALAPRVEALSASEVGLTTVGITLKEGTPTEDCNKNLFGMRPWYAGLAVQSPETNNKCTVGTPATDEDIATMVWIIILNIMTDISVIIGYLALGFVIYGGYLYILAGGDPGKVAKGKKTLIGAVIGIAISLLASGIVNTILRIIGA